MKHTVQKIVLFILLAGCYMQLGAQTQTVKLSTGVNDGNNTLIAFGDHDDTWTVRTPGGNNISAKVCKPYFGWASSSGCSRWITPHIKTDNYPRDCNSGTYTYKTSFILATANPCSAITSAVVNFSAIGGDNDVQTFRINGHSYPIRPGVKDFLELLPQIVNLNITDLVAGANNIEIDVRNIESASVTGLNICGSLEITRTPVPPLQPSFNANPVYCQGTPLTFNGSDGPGTATSYFWEILEWDTNNNIPLPGGYSWSSSYTGAPGSYTFPVAPLHCNTKYKIKLAVANACQGWTETNRFIYYACNPVNAGPNQFVTCPGNCVQVGTPAQAGYQYTWTNGSGTIIGNTAQITVCPMVTSTYTLTVTNVAMNCSSSDHVTVFVVANNNPAFILDTTNAGGNAYVTCTATPVVTNANTVPGFGEMYIVEEINPQTGATVPGTNSSQGNNPNPPCWWVYPNAVNFKGYNGTQNVATNPNCHLVTPVPGRFGICRRYRITRGTWNNNCPWAQSSQIFNTICPTVAGGKMSVVVAETEAPDYSYLRYQVAGVKSETEKTDQKIVAENGAFIYPNPSSGIFTITLNGINADAIEVYNMVGVKIKTISLRNDNTTCKLDLSGYPKGVYMVNIILKDGKVVKKIVIE